MALRNTDNKDTLIIVTADHSHTLTINGYPKRGDDILGFSNWTQNMNRFETLTYANGPSFYDHINAKPENVNDTWLPFPNEETRRNLSYRHLSSVYVEAETHGGEDVGVYATGKSIQHPTLYEPLLQL